MSVTRRSRLPGKVDLQAVGVSWSELVVNSGALVALPMQESSGTTLFDVSGNGRNLTLYGSYSLLSSGPGSASSVAFSGGYGVLPYAVWMNVTSITIEMMFKTTDLSAPFSMLACRDGGGSNRPWIAGVTGSGQIKAYSNNQYGPVKSSIASGLDDGNWHYLAWSVDSSGNGAHIVDSNVDNNYTGGGAIVTPTFVDINIARDPVGGSANWPGSIAYFAIYGSKLSNNTLQEHRLSIPGLV